MAGISEIGKCIKNGEVDERHLEELLRDNNPFSSLVEDTNRRLNDLDNEIKAAIERGEYTKKRRDSERAERGIVDKQLCDTLRYMGMVLTRIQYDGRYKGLNRKVQFISDALRRRISINEEGLRGLERKFRRANGCEEFLCDVEALQRELSTVLNVISSESGYDSILKMLKKDKDWKPYKNPNGSEVEDAYIRDNKPLLRHFKDIAFQTEVAVVPNYEQNGKTCFKAVAECTFSYPMGKQRKRKQVPPHRNKAQAALYAALCAADARLDKHRAYDFIQEKARMEQNPDDLKELRYDSQDRYKPYILRVGFKTKPERVIHWFPTTVNDPGKKTIPGRVKVTLRLESKPKEKAVAYKMAG